jgi:hypothetical protein
MVGSIWLAAFFRDVKALIGKVDELNDVGGFR